MEGSSTHQGRFELDSDSIKNKFVWFDIQYVCFICDELT